MQTDKSICILGYSYNNYFELVDQIQGMLKRIFSIMNFVSLVIKPYHIKWYLKVGIYTLDSRLSVQMAGIIVHHLLGFYLHKVP